jgi:hypothetical protein
VLSVSSVSAVRGDQVRGVRRSLPTTTRQLKNTKSEKSEKHGPKKRDCKLKSKEDKVEYECESEEDGMKDKIKFRVEAKSAKGLKVNIEYEQKGVDDEATADVETETKTKYEIFFDKVIEYKKKNEGDEDDPDTQAFDWEEDTILQELSMENWEDFSDIVDDGTLIKFSVASPDDVVKFFFTITREYLVDLNLTANTMKLDFELTEFPWERDDSYVALLCSVTSGQKVNVKDETSDSSHKGHKHKKEVKVSFDQASNAMDFTPFGEYTWKTEAEVIIVGDGNETEANATTTEEIQVIATSPNTNDTEDSDQIAFSFVGEKAQNASDIFWDPSAGVGYESGAVSMAATFSLAMVTVSSLLFLL